MSESNVRAHIARLTTDAEYRRTVNELTDLGARMAFQNKEGLGFEGHDVGPALAEMGDGALEAAGGGACRDGDHAACGRVWDRKALECSAVNGGGENCCK